ncbi:hypothetical protein EVAR_62267_1 [Eumeta japonica]|uniref:Uncharacterized protein n=1 Tax=Eumeta variegata TaxID=151549 RepID=A0A4C1Z188_EUMVA|nr:hypothetical protein EVAR_62267_1 [Eumeta japonica]
MSHFIQNWVVKSALSVTQREPNPFRTTRLEGRARQRAAPVTVVEMFKNETFSVESTALARCLRFPFSISTRAAAAGRAGAPPAGGMLRSRGLSLGIDRSRA